MLYRNGVKKRSYKKRSPDAPLPDVAVNIKRYRGLTGLTADQLAVEADVSTLGMLESGRRPSGRINNLEKIATALTRLLGYEVTVADLRGRPSASADPAPGLDRFLASPLGSDATSEERRLLRSMTWGGGTPNEKAWYLALGAIREAQSNKKGG